MEYVIANGELYHYGVKGMKWGVHKSRAERKEIRRDNRTARELTRHAAASKRNLKMRGRMSNEVESQYEEARSDYNKALGKITLSRSKKQAMVEEATNRLSSAGKAAAKSRAELNRAERIYDADEKALRAHMDKLAKKYGTEKVTAIKTRDYKLGEHYVKEMVKTGITAADLPLFGTRYTAWYVGKKDADDRQRLIDDEADKRY